MTISEEALVALCSYDFPGNIRELQNILQQAIIKSSAGSSITSEDFPFSLSQSEFSFKSWKETRRQAILSWEKEYLSRVLTASSGHKSSAAQRLQLTRQMLYKLMKRHRML
ncbi:MAG TPA: helix-turn-helix domain-containing protein [Nitrospiria bacterium]